MLSVSTAASCPSERRGGTRICWLQEMDCKQTKPLLNLLWITAVILHANHCIKTTTVESSSLLAARARESSPCWNLQEPAGSLGWESLELRLLTPCLQNVRKLVLSRTACWSPSSFDYQTWSPTSLEPYSPFLGRVHFCNAKGKLRSSIPSPAHALTKAKSAAGWGDRNCRFHRPNHLGQMLWCLLQIRGSAPWAQHSTTLPGCSNYPLRSPELRNWWVTRAEANERVISETSLWWTSQKTFTVQGKNQGFSVWIPTKKSWENLRRLNSGSWLGNCAEFEASARNKTSKREVYTTHSPLGQDPQEGRTRRRQVHGNFATDFNGDILLLRTLSR